MVRNAKVYGKQKTNELVSAFQKLDLTTPPKCIDSNSQPKVNFLQLISSGLDIDIQQLPALAPVTGNKRRARRVENDDLKNGTPIVEIAPERKISQQIHELNAKA